MDARASVPDERMLRSLAEQLKVPLTLIARHAELKSDDSLEVISGSSANALRLVEAYLLSNYLYGQQQLQLEPVSLKAMLYDVAHELEPLAKRANKTIELSQQGRWGQVMAHQTALKTALHLLGQAIFTQSSSSATDAEIVIIRAHKLEDKVQTGLYSTTAISAEALAIGRDMYGRARQAVPSASAEPAAEIYLADSLLQSMAAGLQVSRWGSLTGLVTNLTPSRQLTLI